MLREAFKTIRAIKPVYLLIVFSTLSIIARFNDDLHLLENPVSLHALTIPVLAVMGHFMTLLWIGFISLLKHLLPETDGGDFAILAACSLLAFNLLITFSYMSNNPNILNASLLIKPGFIYTCTMYIMSLVAFNIKR